MNVETWRLLRGKGALWHRTSLVALSSIRRDGKIKPNTDGRFDREYGQSDISYSRHLDGVSLLDLDSETEERIKEHVDKYNLISSMPPQVIIELSRDSLEPSRLLLPAVLTEGTDPRLPIETSAFESFTLVARDDAGERLCQLFPVTAVDEMYDTARQWVDESEAGRRS